MNTEHVRALESDFCRDPASLPVLHPLNTTVLVVPEELGDFRRAAESVNQFAVICHDPIFLCSDDVLNDMFMVTVNTSCNTFRLVGPTIAPMHEQMKRLYEAAAVLRRIHTQSELARALNQSPQSVNNWEKRGLSKTGMLEAQRVLGCSATWLATGEGEMVLSIPSGPIAPGALRVVGSDGNVEPLPSKVRIPKVTDIRLSAGVNGVTVNYDRRDDGVWDVPRRWLEKGQYVPECLYAIEVTGESMEPNYYEGDVVVVDSADRALVSGHVYAVNCDGEVVIKRLVREGPLWYLYSDNPLPRYHKVLISNNRVEIIGKIVLRQTYHVT